MLASYLAVFAALAAGQCLLVVKLADLLDDRTRTGRTATAGTGSAQPFAAAH